MEILTQWATLLSPIISVLAIIVALIVARSSSRDAQEQIKTIRHLLDVFVAAHNLEIVEAERIYSEQLKKLDNQIENARMELDIVNPFPYGPRIERIMDEQNKDRQKTYINHLLAKRNELENNLSLINDYLNKATRK